MIQGGFSFAILCSSVMIAESLTIRVFGYTSEPTVYLHFYYLLLFCFLYSCKLCFPVKFQTQDNIRNKSKIILCRIQGNIVSTNCYLCFDWGNHTAAFLKWVILSCNTHFCSLSVALGCNSISCVHKLSILWLVHT